MIKPLAIPQALGLLSIILFLCILTLLGGCTSRVLIEKQLQGTYQLVHVIENDGFIFKPEGDNFLEIGDKNIIQVIHQQGKRHCSYTQQGHVLKLTSGPYTHTWTYECLPDGLLYMNTNLGIYVLKGIK